MHMSKRVRGSISILLCLILLPMVTYSTMIIDAARLQTVRSNIAGAGELTLNAIMSDYNVLLEEMYGLFANCNDEKELHDALQAYFQQTIEGRFLHKAGCEDQYLQNMINGAVDTAFDADGNAIDVDLTDFLATQLMTDTFSAGPVDGSALANPNTMKRQIIEYMKYRGPISVASTLLGKLDYLSNSQTQVDACDKKVAYTEKLGELQDPCLEAYEAIESEYNMGTLMINEMLGEGFIANNSKVDGMDEIIKDSKKQYEYATAFYLMNAQSPFYNNGNQYTFSSLGNEAFKAARDKGDIDAKYVNVDNLNYYFDYEPGPEVENPTRSNRITCYMNALEDILIVLHDDCNYDKSGKKISTFDTIQAQIKDNGQRWYDGLNRYVPAETLPEGYSRPKGESYYATITASNTAEQYPNYSKIETDSGSLFQPYLNLPDSTADETKFQTQLDKTKEVFAAQKLLHEDIKPEIMKFSLTNMQFCQLRDRYNQIWDALADRLREEYADDYKPIKAQYDIDKKAYDDAWKQYDDDYTKWENRIKEIEEEIEKHKDDEDYTEPDKPEAPSKPTITKPVEPDKDSIWNTVCNRYSRLNALEEQREAINQIANSMSLYSSRIDEYIKKASKNNQKYFLDYAQAYNESGYSGIAAVGMTLKTMKDGLKKASGKLDEILNIINGQGGLKDKQKEWKKTINSVNSDSTKAAMTSDFNTMVDKFDEGEVKKLKTLIDDKLMKHVDQMLSDIEKITYIGQSMFRVSKASKLFKEWVQSEFGKKLEDKFGKIGDITRSEILNKAYDILWDKLGIDEELPVLPDYSSDQTIKEYKGGTNHDTEVTPDNVYKMAQQLVAEKYDAKHMYEEDGTTLKKIEHFQVLDGIRDEQGCAYTQEDKTVLGIDKMKAEDKKLKEEGKDGLTYLDPEEAFVITLFTEAQAAKKAEDNSGSSEEQSADNICDAAQGEINNATTAPPSNSSTTTTQTLANEDIAAIMSDVEGYTKGIQDKQAAQAPAMSTATINKKKPGKSSGGKALEKAKTLLADFGNLGQKVIENVYLEEYFTEMFSCRTDNQMLNGLTADPDKKSLPVIMMNGYGNKASKASRQLNVDTEWYGKEIEYLLWGNSDLDTNLVYTDGMIFAIRFALNAIYAFTAPDIQTYALELATAIAGWTVVGVPIVQVCITLLIALAESGYDIYLLHDGRDVPIYKNQATFVCSPQGMLKEVATEAAKKITEAVIDDFADKVEEKLDDAIETIGTKVADTATAKVSSVANEFTTTINEFGDKQFDAIYSAVQKQFITPVLNQIIPVGSLVELSEMYESADPAELVKDAVGKALDRVQDSIDGKLDEAETTEMSGVVITICREIMKDKRSELESMLQTELTNYFATIKKPELPKIDLEKTLRTKLDKVLDPYKERITEEVEKAKKFITDKIKNAKEVTVDAAKSFVHEQMETATAALTGKAHELTDSMLSQIPAGKSIDTDASSGVTLNYKEYCKIFMLIFVTANQDKILQRAAVLVTANVRHEASRPQADFDITKAHTMFSVNAQVEMMTLFPWPVKDIQDETSSDTGIKLDLNNIRSSNMLINYCGVNGY